MKQTVILSLALMAVIIIMIVPVPSWMLDVGLVISFGLAILIFTITMFIEKPLDFYSFPSILLASLVLRLSLNVCSTKLIIGQGHTGPEAAGEVIQGFANFIMGGSIFLGLVVFGVLMIVNFAVITKGAARMAEVSARFALDAMPGKQLSIDADMSAGAITHVEAKARREYEQQETTFFGSLDGVSKFVKGDAVAGLLITALNFFMGLAMGYLVHDMGLGQALQTYTLLTVGDGLVSQIPAVIISISAGLLLARGGARESTDKAVFEQIGRHPAALATVAIIMAFFSFVPGMPFLPFFGASFGLGFLAWKLGKEKKLVNQITSSEEKSETPKSKTLGDVLDVDDIHVEFSQDLVNMVLDPGIGLDVRIANMRTHVAKTFGLVLPEIRLTDSAALATGTYVLKIHGVEMARGQLNPDLVLALLPDEPLNLPTGDDVLEPVYGAPARWIKPSQQEKVALSGITIVTPTEVLATHLLEVIKRNFGRLLTFKSLRRILDEMTALSNSTKAEANRRFLDELIPEKIQLDTLHQVLKLLLDEQVSIRNLPLILEAIAEVRGHANTPEAICEHVRRRISFQLVANVRRDDGSVPLIQLAPEWEDTFLTYQMDGAFGALDVALPPEKFEVLSEGLAKEVGDAGSRGIYPAIVTSARRRRFLRTVMSAKGISNPVMSFEELGVETRPALVGVVSA